jgi:uncharacterized membrane protein
MTFMAKHISVSIERRAAEVYEFASNPENLPQWAEGLSGSIKKVDDEWIAAAPMGTVKVNFVAVCVRIPDRFLTLSLDSCTAGLI